MKKVATLLTVLFLFFSLSACDAETSIDVNKNNKQTEQTTDEVQQEEKKKEVKEEEKDSEKQKAKEEEKRAAEQKAREEAEKVAAEAKAREEKEKQDLIQSLGLVQSTVTRVVDGDTFELSDGSKVRLIGVNTPESTARTEPYGK